MREILFNKFSILTFIFISIISISAYCQKNQEINKYIIPFKSIDYKSDNKDFLFLKSTLANTKVVMLGENMHGDGSTLTAKLKLIKYLHEELGFNVLAIECAGFYQSNRIMQEAKLNPNLIKEIEKTTIFNEYAEIQLLYDYIIETQNKPNPLEIIGFDCRHYPFWREKKHGSPIKELDSILITSNIKYVKQGNYKRLLPLIDHVLSIEFRDTISETNKQFFISSLDTVVSQLQNLKNEKYSIWIQELKSIKGHGNNSWTAIIDANYLNNNARDFQMADNLKWLINEKYKGQKVIVSAHNGHILKDDECIEFKQKDLKPPIKQIPMGQWIKNEYNDKCYSIGFCSYKGSYLVNDSLYILKPAAQGSLEEIFHSRGNPYLFLDYNKIPSNHILSKKQSLRCLLYEEAVSEWQKVFDGLVYIDEMYPATIKK